MERVYLVCLRPPSNIDADLCRLQRRVFQSTGFTSAFALPPLIPLSFAEEEPVDPREPERQSQLLELGPLEVTPDAVWVGVTPASLVAGLKCAAGPGGAEGWIRLHPGFFVCLHEHALDSAGRSELQNIAIPQGRWRASRICCFRVECRNRKEWWEDVYIEEVWGRKLRKNA